MKVTVCELPDDTRAFAVAWEALISEVTTQQSELVLLSELPFYSWFPREPVFNAKVWQKAQEAHERQLKKLEGFAPAIVLGTSPLTQGQQHLNRAFLWTPAEGYKGIHDKYYLPNEEDFYERCWFDRSQRNFTPAHIQDLTIGFLICSELMFTEWARSYGKQGTHIIAVPRATSSHERWLVAARMAAIASGAFVLSSNRIDERIFGGRGLVINPEGEILASTSCQIPFVTIEIDLEESIQAKKTYPRDIPD